MIHLPLEGLRAMLSSVTFGMDDGIDRLTRKFTVIVVLVDALFVGSNRYIGAPISCATAELPPGISQHWVDTYWWLSDRKMAPLQTIGIDHSKQPTSFYQLTLETLMMVAIVASLPGFLWRAFLGRSGFQLKSITQLVSAAKQSVGAQREIHTKALAQHIKISSHYHRQHLTFDQDCSRRLRHLHESRNCIRSISYWHPKSLCQNQFFIPIMYILIKVIYIFMIIMIFILLRFCLGFDFSRFGVSVINKIRYENISAFFDDKFFPQ